MSAFIPSSAGRAAYLPGRRWRAATVAGSMLLLFGGMAHGQVKAEGPDSRVPASTSAIEIEDARRQIGAGKFRGAEAALQRYLAANEASADAHALLGYTQMRLNQPKKSLQEFTRAAQLRTPTAQELRSVAEDYVLLDDYADADHWANRALLLDRGDPETWYSLGRIRYSLQRFQDAAQCFEKTLELLPGSVKAADNLGLAYEGLNRAADAEREYRVAIGWQAGSAHPSEQPLLNLAIMLIHQGKELEALPLLTQAVAIAPEDPRIHDQLGHVYLNRNALPEAQVQFEKAVSLVPQSGAYHFLLGQVYRRRGMAKDAREQFEVAAALETKHSSSVQ